jgi:TonB family protein
VVLNILVGPDGRVIQVKVVRSLGLGLDEQAVTAVRKWRFRAAIRDGKPVPAPAMVEVNFRLL